MNNDLFNPYHSHDPVSDTHVICEWIDAGIYSGDLLHTCNLKEFKEYVESWNRAVIEHEKILKLEENENKHLG